MIELKLPMGQIFSCDAQAPGQENFLKVEGDKKCHGSQE